MLVVDAAQGIEAQTVANAYLAIENDLEIVPVVEQDRPAAGRSRRRRGRGRRPHRRTPDHVLRISAKTGVGVAEVLDAVVERIPPPAGDPDAPARALIFDSSYDQYRGVVAFVRVVDGTFRPRERAPRDGAGHALRGRGARLLLADDAARRRRSTAGEVGYVITGLKDVARLRVGDTLTAEARPAAEPLPGYKDVKPMVFAGLFPTDSDEYPELRDALERLKLNDAALFYEPETSQALGFGFRCGFLGLLHMEIVRERLEREFDLDLLVTAPNVAYRVRRRPASEVEVHNPAEMPREVEEVDEPYIKASIIVPKEYVGAVMELNNERRGALRPHGVPLRAARAPLLRAAARRDRPRLLRPAEVADARVRELRLRLRRLPAGRARARGHPDRRRARRRAVADHPPRRRLRARPALVERLREEIPRQFFDVPIQAAIGSRVIARETVKAKRKDVLAKCYGGDISRKRKLLEKQKKGKKRMKQVGAVEVPQEAFLAVLNLDERRRDEMALEPRHLYLHLPFCAHRCGYCDFVTAVGRRRTQHGAYVDALLARARAGARRASRRGSETIFLGGGTPTFTEPAALERLLRRAARRGRGDGRGESGDGDALPCPASVAEPCQPCVVRRAELPAAASRRARAACPARGRPPLRCNSCVMPDLTTSRSISSTASRARATSDLDSDLAEALALEPEHVSCYELEAKPGTRFTHAHGAELERQAESMEAYFERVVGA